jgi:hypothetical protein
MKNPFKLYQDKYLWYCKQCWTTGVIATNPDTLETSVKQTCYNIHSTTNINKCKAKISSIVVHKHKPIIKKSRHNS